MSAKFALAVSFKYPQLTCGDDWYFQDDGGGPYLAKWPDGYELPSDAEIAEAEYNEARTAFKSQRAELVAAIKVTSSLGRTFDGGEVDTSRMLKPITVLKEKPEGSTWLWVLADNTPAQVGLLEFLEVLELAGRAQTRLWLQE